MKKIKNYYYLIKPGIVRGNLIAATAGFLFAFRGNINLLLLLQTLVGLGFVIASGCVVNNYIDREIDGKMERTKKRVLVTGEILGRDALIFASILGLVGVILLLLINPLTARAAIAGFLLYVAAYGYWKRRSVYGTLVGSMSGAIPPVVGYVAITNSLDVGAALLFLILVFWQMPHFYAIGIYRLKDYGEAHLPILPVVSGVAVAKRHIYLYSVGFLVATLLLVLFGYAGMVYLLVMAATGGYWVYKAYKGKYVADDDVWARKFFSLSLMVLLIFCVMISIDFLLP
mgnify:CR=1 FL=1